MSLKHWQVAASASSTASALPLHFDLLRDQRLRAVATIESISDAAVHRARMHHQGIGLGVGELFWSSPK